MTAEDIATDCDWCGRGIAYNETCYSIPNGTTYDDLPVVKIKCVDCYGSTS